MKVFLALSLTFFLENLMAQDSVLLGHNKFGAISVSSGLTIYYAPCEAGNDYKFASRFIVSYDSIRHFGYLASYKYADYFGCQDSIDRLTMEQIKSVLSEKKSAEYQIAILFGMEDNNREFIGYLAMFKKRKFEKFLKKVNQPAKWTFSGEEVMVSKYDYSKYAKEFVLAKVGNKLSLIVVN